MPISVVFWQGLHLLAFSDPALKRGAVQIVVLLTGFCVKRGKIIGKWKLPKRVSQLLINQTRKDPSGRSHVHPGSNLGTLPFKYCIKEIEVNLRKCSTQIEGKYNFFLILWKARPKKHNLILNLCILPSCYRKHKAILKSISLINKQCLHSY